MNIHEYQAKAVLREFGVPVSRGKAVYSLGDVDAATRDLPGPLWVVKSQIHAGGRGKGKFKEAEAGDKGGVRLARSPEEVRTFAEQMLGKTLVTLQTGPAGKQVNRLYVEEGSDIASEFYLSALVDRETSRVAFVVSTEGGMNIEQVAHGADAGAQGRSRQTGRGSDRQALPRLHRAGHEHAGDQPAHRHARREAPLPRRQDQLRLERALPSSRHHGSARPDRGGREG